MMRALYSSPMRVYLALLLIALFGIWMGMGLPVSLFPNSSKPKIWVGLAYGGMGSEDFKLTYGGLIESRLQGMNDQHLHVEKVAADYYNSRVQYVLEFSWGNDAQEALKETDLLVRSVVSNLPKEVRDSVWVDMDNENTGFFAASFYSETRSLTDVYKELEPLLTPRLSQVGDAKRAMLWNPRHRNVTIELDPARLASLQLFPRHIEDAIQTRTVGYSAGSMQMGYDNLPIEVRKPNETIDDLAMVRIDSPTGKSLYLGDIAQIDYRAEGDSGQVRKTNGAPSLILYAQPRPGGNVKKMSEDILRIVQELKPSFSPDIQYRVLVDPSEFIRGAVENVFHEVLIGSLLAVGVLFLFIGSLKNVITAAIEIPLSMVLAFILMRMSGMNLNLISLGGLALASGMNVDASVVVMENIFRHLEKEGTPPDFKGKLELILRSVKEVRLAVIAATIASLVVFAPLAFTSALSYAVLGDLAKTVIFSHGFSAFVALLLVPTVRLHLLSRSKDPKSDIGHSPVEPQIQKVESAYRRLLQSFILSRRKQAIFITSGAVLLVTLVAVVLPRLPKEILGTPDTDWMILSINTRGNTLIKQMENQADEIEAKVLRQFGDHIQYTFTQVHRPNNATVMARLKNKREMKEIWKQMETEFKDDAITRYWVGPWNPAELPLPDSPELKVVVEGGKAEERQDAANSIRDALLDKKVLPKIRTEPSADKDREVVLRPYTQLNTSIRPYDLGDLVRVATEGKRIHYMAVDQDYSDILLKFPKNLFSTAEDLGSLPVGAEGKILPLRALTRVSIETQPPLVHRENGSDLFNVIGRKENSAEKTSEHAFLDQAKEIVENWKASHHYGSGLNVSLVDAQIEMNDAIRQLSVAVALSIFMIFFTLLLQLGNFTNSLIVLAAIPLGFIGVLTSLYVFQSTLSLNSVLGVILLNGIAVGNSIILVDFTETLFKRGLSAREAVLEASRQRLRPIFITSLTTILGMLPVALGFGQGGRVLQPLGIAVSGGLWVSMSLTLFLVPALHYRVLLNRENQSRILTWGTLSSWLRFPFMTKKPASLQIPAIDAPIAPAEPTSTAPSQELIQ